MEKCVGRIFLNDGKKTEEYGFKKNLLEENQ